MEICAPCFTASHLDISNSSVSAQDPSGPSQQSLSAFSMNDLKTCLTDSLNYEDIGVSASDFNLSSGKDDTGSEVAGDDLRDTDKTNHGGTSSAKCFCQSATFPSLHGPKSSDSVAFGEKEKHEEDNISEISEQNGSANELNQPFSRSLSLPVPLKLLSAMKGGRAKQGILPKKLSVTWSPDVYDPIPASVSHVPSQKNQRHRSDGKRFAKYKLKGGSKSSRGSRSKDKKWKNGSNSYSIKPFHKDIEVVPQVPQVGRLESLLESQVRPAEAVF